MRYAVAGFAMSSLLLGAAHASQANYVGIAAAAVPEYEGSDEYRFLPIPMVNYHNGPFFITPRAGLPALGLRAEIAPELDVGVFLGMGLGRKASRTDRTRGLDDIDLHAAVGAYAEWRPGRYSLGAAYRQAAHKGYGGVVELRASYAVWQDRANSLRVGVGTEWANRRAMRTWFGVSPEQAARSDYGLAPYSASSGFKSAALFASWMHRIDERWSAVASVGVNRLLGDAADSPLTARKTNVYGSVGVAYAF